MQRERLRERVSKPVSPQAEAAVAAVIDEFPENFRPPGADPCKLGVFRSKLKDGTKCHVALPRRTSPLVLDEMRRQVKLMAKELNVIGLMNTQLAYQDDEIYVIEVNPRASRTIPFVSKATGVHLANIAVRAMVGISLEDQGFTKEIICLFLR